ncbi:MAG TPA: UDP-N-acetylmuramoyl-tripeptide--D-alanyl-D-alanine ligase [Solirubrobacteraceae bacterium]|nr:UDP-N-acetylmuramoyl-tripeptide--D-alanyl-D-alanine ligase [Solirubrobacteraceae bacterium]
MSIDSRAVGAGALFIGLPGQSRDGGAFAPQAIAAGAWGALTATAHGPAAVEAAARRDDGAAVLVADDPLAALQRLAAAWRAELGALVIGITGSTGKTTTKELTRALLAPHVATFASAANLNTEIGLPLELLRAGPGTAVVVVEMGMRGPGQISQLAEIARPQVGMIVSVGPVHLELLGTIERIAAAKAELIASLAPGATAIVPAGERLLEPHLRGDLRTITFGDGGDVRMLSRDGTRVEIDAAGARVSLEVSFHQAHLMVDLLAAVAAAIAVGVTPSGEVAYRPQPGRGGRLSLPDGITLIDDSYNANPVSMRAALDDLAAAAATRRVAVLGDMLELGADEVAYHERLGQQADAAGVDVLVAVGQLARATAERFGRERYAVDDACQAAALVGELVSPGDVVLVKGSRAVGLERVCAALRGREEPA